MNKTMSSWLTVMKHKEELNHLFTNDVKSVLNKKFTRERARAKFHKDSFEQLQFNTEKNIQKRSSVLANKLRKDKEFMQSLKHEEVKLKERSESCNIKKQKWLDQIRNESMQKKIISR